MRLVTFRVGDRTATGVLEADAVIELDRGEGWPGHMVDLIASYDPERITAALPDAPRHDLSGVELMAPVVPRKNVLAVGRNYVEHVNEVGGLGPPPSHPIVFSKPTTSIIGPGQPIELANDPTGTTDYEGELAVVIGRPGVRIEADDAWSHVFGYTVVNDVTSRELQRRHGQWLIGKGPDTFCPMGPAIVTRDEIEDVGSVTVRTRVNDDVRQEAPVADLIFDIPTLIATISSVMTLESGDVIATGTPGGVGAGFDPPRWLRPGDEVTVTVEGVGELVNPVV